MSFYNAIIYATNKLFDIVYWLIFARVILSWLPFNYNNQTFHKLTEMLISLTEPIIAPFRALLSKTPLGRTPVDFAPFIAMLLLQIIQNLINVLIFMR